MKYSIMFMLLILSISGFSENTDSIEVKVRKLDYNDFIAKYSINDTSSTIINIFFDKKTNYAMGQMSMLPITVAIFPLFPLLSVGTTVVSLPLFVNGTVVLVKYRKKKLQKVLIEYKETRSLPKWVRKKVNKSLNFGRFDEE